MTSKTPNSCSRLMLLLYRISDYPSTIDTYPFQKTSAQKIMVITEYCMYSAMSHREDNSDTASIGQEPTVPALLKHT